MTSLSSVVLPTTFPKILERVKGIEPSQPAWKAGALPLSYTRDKSKRTQTPQNSIVKTQWGKQDSNLRRLSHQIYSLAPLAARVFPPDNHDSNRFMNTTDGGRTALAVFESRGTVATSKSNVK